VRSLSLALDQADDAASLQAIGSRSCCGQRLVVGPMPMEAMGETVILARTLAS